MKKLSFFIMSLIIAFIANANEVLYFYPLEYQTHKDLFVKLAYPVNDAFLVYQNQKYYFRNNGVLLENIYPNNDLSFELGMSQEDKDYKLTEENLVFSNVPSGNILLDKALYKAVSSWSANKEQSVKFSDYLIKLKGKNGIFDEEILSFTQQFYAQVEALDDQKTMAENLQAIFAKSKASPDKPCNCNFVLNHFSSVAPLTFGAGNSGIGYNFLNYPGIPQGRLSEIVTVSNAFNSSSPKWHTWTTKEKGPAHDMFLRTYDEFGSFHYQWSSQGVNNNGSIAPSPNYAYNSFLFMCVGQEFELPKDCDCTKKFCSVYEYNNILKVIAHRLKPLSNVSSTAEELAVITLTNSSGITLIDANRSRAFTECKGDFNFEFLGNLFELGKEIVQVIIDVQDDSNGATINDVPGAIDDIGSALIQLLSSPPINVSGDCEDKYIESALLRNFECFYMKANDPTIITLQSFTFLGVAGSRKWDNYAIAKSDFRLQSYVLTSSLEGTDYCCSDKLGMHVFANMGGPVSTSSHLSNVTGIYHLFGPWDNFTPVGYLPIMPINANRGYFTYELKAKDCAPIIPGKKLVDEEEVFSLFSELESAKSIESNEALEPKIDEELAPINAIGFNPLLDFKLYPNPTNSVLNLELSHLNTGSKLDISVYDMTGDLIEIIFQGHQESENLAMQWISNSELKFGTYFIVIRQDNVIIDTQAFLFKP